MPKNTLTPANPSSPGRQVLAALAIAARHAFNTLDQHHCLHALSFDQWRKDECLAITGKESFRSLSPHQVRSLLRHFHSLSPNYNTHTRTRTHSTAHAFLLRVQQESHYGDPALAHISTSLFNTPLWHNLTDTQKYKLAHIIQRKHKKP